MASDPGELRALVEGVGIWLASFEPSGLDAPAAVAVLGQAATLEKMAASAKAMAGTRVAETSAHKPLGDRSAAHTVARLAGSSVGQASDALETARRLRSLEKTSRAVRRGELSPRQASLVAGAAARDPSAEPDLLATARRGSLGELHQSCVRVRAAADRDPEATRRRIHARRSLRSHCGLDGSWNLQVRDTPQAGARFMAVLSPLIDQRFRAARRSGRHESLQAYAADALAQMARSVQDASRPARPGGTPRPGDEKRSRDAKIIVRVDLAALLQGYPERGQVCEIVGFGPVAVSAVTDMMDTEDPFLAAVATRGEAVVGAVHLGRRPRALQRTALQWLYPVCAVEGCSSQSHLEIDHTVDWSRSHITVFDLLDRLCSHHHALKTRQNWALVEGRGKRPFVPPGDPRHPT